MRIKDAGRGRLRQVKAMYPCHGAGVCSRDSGVALQRGRTGIQSGDRPWERCQRLPALFFEIRPLTARSSYQVLEHPKLAAPVITNVLVDESGNTGVYYDEKGHPMLGSALVRDPAVRGPRRR